MSPPKPTIRSLVGESVSGVAFVMDYVEFHFDGRVLRALSNPILVGDGSRATFPEVGSRDALCSIIGRTVTEVVVDEDVEIRLTFDSPQTLIVPLAPDARVGPEAAHFQDPRAGVMDVW